MGYDSMEWQPIETAPKNGTTVLVARLDPDGSDWYAVAQWWVNEFAFMYGDSRQLRHPLLLCFEPTDWMPLPSPPKQPLESPQKPADARNAQNHGTGGG